MDLQAEDLRSTAEHLARTSQTCEEFVRRIQREWQAPARTSLQEFESFVSQHGGWHCRTVNGVRERINVTTGRGFFEMIKDRHHEATDRAASHPETDSRLRALIHAGIKPDDAILVLRRSLSFRGGRFLAVSALERDVLPHLSTPLTPQQADLLVKLAQNAYDE